MTDAISEQELQALRLRIDNLDERILELISDRARCAEEVARVKMKSLAEGEKPRVESRGVECRESERHGRRDA